MTRTRLTTAATLVAVLAWAAPAGATGEQAAAGGDNTAVAVNTKDGHDVFRLAFHVNRVTSEVVDNTNAAVAYASCTDCQTVAIAIQVVLVMSDPSVVTPQNLALAINQECTACDTLASAYQLVISTGGPVRLTPEGRRRIAEIRRQLHELRHSGLSGPEIQARVNALTAELAQVVRSELVPVGRRDEDRDPSASEDPVTTTTAPARRGTGSSSSTSTSTPTSSSSTSTTVSTTSTTVP